MSASRSIVRVLMLALLAGMASACSSIPDWVDPTTWGGSSASEPATAPDESSSAASEQSTSEGGKTVAEARDKYPALADTPDKRPATSSSDEQKQVASALVADRTQAQYSAEALQAGNEPAASPPPPASAEASVAVAPAAASREQSNAAPAPGAAAAQTAVAQPGVAAPMPGTLPAEAQAGTSTPIDSAAPVAAPSPPLPGAQAALPRAQRTAADDTALGFQPSHAPPLDPAVAQMMGGTAPPHSARLASLAPAAPVLAFSSTPAAVVSFPNQTIAIEANGMAQVQAAASAFKAKGGNGYVRVMGHSASGAPGLSADKQLMQSFERSQAIATAVARELIKQGVPAGRVLVDATSSLAPDEQRRAEIFLQS